MSAHQTILRSSCGSTLPLDTPRWRRAADEVEVRLLDTLLDPVMDVGCGPGRIVGALARAGRVALGVDASPTAVDEARRTGAAVLDRSVFSPLPGERRWSSVVLFDGNIGIGGDPVVLLRRVGELLAPGGVVLSEVDPPGIPTTRLTVRIEQRSCVGPWFAWARVSADDIDDLERTAGLAPMGVERHGDRWFARASRP